MADINVTELQQELDNIIEKLSKTKDQIAADSLRECYREVREELKAAKQQRAARTASAEFAKDESTMYARKMYADFSASGVPALSRLSELLLRVVEHPDDHRQLFAAGIPVLDHDYDRIKRDVPHLLHAFTPPAVHRSPTLAAAVSTAINSWIPSGSDSLLGAEVDLMFGRLIELVARSGGVTGLQRIRNKAEESMTIKHTRPDKCILLEGALLFKEEDKSDAKQFSASQDDLVKKMPDWNEYTHNKLGYMLGMVVAGPLVQIFAITKKPECIRLHNRLDVAQLSNKLTLMVYAMTTLGIIVEQRKLLPEVFLRALVKTQYRNGTTIEDRNFGVVKVVDLDMQPSIKLEFMSGLYASTAGCKYLISLLPGTKPKVDRRRIYTVHLTPHGQQLGEGLGEQHRPQTWQETALMARCLTLALKVLHEAGYAHTDIRWPNVLKMVTHNGERAVVRYVLIDLESAVQLGAAWDRDAHGPMRVGWLHDHQEVLQQKRPACHGGSSSGSGNACGMYDAEADFVLLGRLLETLPLNADGKRLVRQLKSRQLSADAVLQHPFLANVQLE